MTTATRAATGIGTAVETVVEFLSKPAYEMVRSALLFGGLLIFTPRVAQGASGLLGIDDSLSEFALSSTVAVLVVVARHRLHLDGDAVREACAMRDSLRRYVPGAIAEQLANGTDLAPGTRQVTVLFVDIRGYASFARNLRLESVFATIDHYTTLVSEIICAHGGTVVEFNGDGMMAVFGAPRDLADKEQAAVAAGCEIFAKVRTLQPVQANADDPNLSVGVGIATGEAFVGSIHAVDRMIWTALGNTTNLAARLQTLTRDLDVAVALEPTTWNAVRETSPGFESRRATIRGWPELEEIYALPVPIEAALDEPCPAVFAA